MPVKLNSSIVLAVLFTVCVAHADDEAAYSAALERTSGLHAENLPNAIADLDKVVGDRVPEGPYGLRALRKLYQLHWQSGRLQDAEKASVRFLSSTKLTPAQRSTALYERSMILKGLGDERAALRILQSLQTGPAAAGLPESMRTNVQRWAEELAVEAGAATQKDQEQITKRLESVLKGLKFADERQWPLASSDIERLHKIAPKKAVGLLKREVLANPTSAYAPRGFLLAGTLEHGQMEDISIPELKKAQESFTAHDEAYWNIVYLRGLALAKKGQRQEAIEPLRQVGYSDGTAELRAAALRLLGYQYQELGMEAEARAAARDSARPSPEAAQLAMDVFPEYKKELEIDSNPGRKDFKYGGETALGVILLSVSVGGFIWRRRFLPG